MTAAKSSNGAAEIGTNVKAEIAGSILKIEIDLDAATKPSKSGKTAIIGTTHGATAVAPNKIVNLNVYSKA